MHTKMKKGEVIFLLVLTVVPLIQFCIMWVGVNLTSFILPFQKYVITLRLINSEHK